MQIKVKTKKHQQNNDKISAHIILKTHPAIKDKHQTLPVQLMQCRE
jgi:hypothetical protein